MRSRAGSQVRADLSFFFLGSGKHVSTGILGRTTIKRDVACGARPIPTLSNVDRLNTVSHYRACSIDYGFTENSREEQMNKHAVILRKSQR